MKTAVTVVFCGLLFYVIGYKLGQRNIRHSTTFEACYDIRTDRIKMCWVLPNEKR